MFENIANGDKIEITLHNEENTMKAYTTLIDKVLTDNKISVYAPITAGQIIKLPRKAKYKLLVYTKNSSLYEFYSLIDDFVKVEKIDYYILKVTSDGKKIQQRNFYRFPTILPLKFSVISEDTIMGQKDEYMDGIIKDISGGGLQFVSNGIAEENKIIKVVYILDGKTMILMSKLLERRDYGKGDYKFLYRAQFINITKNEQEIIIHYIFNQQRKINQRMINKTKNN